MLSSSWRRGVLSLRAYTTSTKHISQSAVLQDGHRAKVTWDNGSENVYDATWLRLNCKSCLHETSQRLVSAADLKLPIVIQHAETDNGGLRLQFVDGHETFIEEGFLEEHAWTNTTRQTPLPSLPAPRKVSWDEIKDEDPVGLWKMISAISENGLVVITNTPNKEGAVADITTKIGPVMDTLYDKLFDVISMPDPINIAYTGEKLAYHMDLPYYESPPGLQALHCRAFTKEVTGGESTFLDAHAAAEVLRMQDPEAFDVLTKVPAAFQKDHLKRERPARFFYKRPHINLNHKGEVISVFWSPPFEGVLRVDPDLVQPYYDAYAKLCNIIEAPETSDKYGYKFRLQEGETAFFSNRRMLHGRESFKLNGGQRHLQGCYCSIDDFNNKLHSLAPSQAPPGYIFEKTGNADYH